jgi:ferredoxin
MRVGVDEITCTGHGLCAREGPRVYELDELGFNRTNAEVAEGYEDEARAGAAACPENAITIVENGE